MRNVLYFLVCFVSINNIRKAYSLDSIKDLIVWSVVLIIYSMSLMVNLA